MVGGVPAYDICGWTYQSRAAISSQTVNASQLPSVTSAISVDCGGTSTSTPGMSVVPATIASTASKTSRERSS